MQITIYEDATKKLVKDDSGKVTLYEYDDEGQLVVTDVLSI